MRYLKTYKLFEGLDEYDIKSWMEDEESDRTILKKYLIENCNDFLDLSKKASKRETWRPKSLDIWRTSRNLRHSQIEVLPGVYRLSSNLERNPVDMPKSIHQKINDKFNEKFGWPVRNGIFCLKSFLLALRYSHLYSERYGVSFKTYLFIPIGKFKYCWSPVYKDLYAEILGYKDINHEETWQTNTGEWGYKEKIEEKIGDKEIQDIVSTYKDTDLEKNGPYSYGYPYDECEISFNCKEYLLIDTSYYENDRTGFDFWNW